MYKQKFVKVEPLYKESKYIIKKYYVELGDLEEEKNKLLNELDVINNSVAEKLNTLETLDLDNRINLNLDIHLLKNKSEVIEKMLDEVNEKFDKLYLKYAGLLISAKKEEDLIRGKYNVTEIIEKHKTAILMELNDLGKQSKEQYLEVAPYFREIFSKPIVKEYHPRYSQLFDFESLRPRYYTLNKRVVKLEEVDQALYGGDISDLIKYIY
ncbi:hypothetical protein [Lysinibacillus capsici]|uniref:hypothetical protein n=1 Tax=Lysinibacillus capsici TaxID=2115968 RepID=UPI0034E3C69C